VSVFGDPRETRPPSRARRAWRWFASNFGATATPERPEDLVPLRDGARATEVQVLAAKLHANGIKVWISDLYTPPLPWPEAALPHVRGVGMSSLDRSSLFVRRDALADATALLDEPSPFDEADLAGG
jgi:hypothetical protein